VQRKLSQGPFVLSNNPVPLALTQQPQENGNSTESRQERLQGRHIEQPSPFADALAPDGRLDRDGALA